MAKKSEDTHLYLLKHRFKKYVRDFVSTAIDLDELSLSQLQSDYVAAFGEAEGLSLIS